jgi:hypothetical protein
VQPGDERTELRRLDGVALRAHDNHVRVGGTRAGRERTIDELSRPLRLPIVRRMIVGAERPAQQRDDRRDCYDRGHHPSADRAPRMRRTRQHQSTNRQETFHTKSLFLCALPPEARYRESRCVLARISRGSACRTRNRGTPAPQGHVCGRPGSPRSSTSS